MDELFAVIALCFIVAFISSCQTTNTIIKDCSVDKTYKTGIFIVDEYQCEFRRK